MASAACTPDMQKAGYSFDVLVFGGHPTDEDSHAELEHESTSDTNLMDVQLVELNIFGASTGCGSCLFHWIRDAEMLYGKQQEVEFRIAL